MVIILNKIPVNLLNRDMDIYIQPCTLNFLVELNKTEPFVIYDIVVYNELKTRFNNLLLYKEKRTLSIDWYDILIFVIKTGDRYEFNQLILS